MFLASEVNRSKVVGRVCAKHLKCVEGKKCARPSANIRFRPELSELALFEHAGCLPDTCSGVYWGQCCKQHQLCSANNSDEKQSGPKLHCSLNLI